MCEYPIIAFIYFTVHFNLTETTNAIAMFFVGVTATLVVVLVVLVSIWLYKRRHQTPRLSTGIIEVDTTEMQNLRTPEPSPNNQVCISFKIFSHKREI